MFKSNLKIIEISSIKTSLFRLKVVLGKNFFILVVLFLFLKKTP